MNEELETSLAAPPALGAPYRLKENVIGPWGLAALAIGVTSPAMGLYSLWGIMQSETGPVTPLIFLAATVLTLPTAISYALLNQHVPSAGAASTWLWKALSRTAGFQAGLLMATYFAMGVVDCPLLFAMFFNDFLRLLGAPISSTLSLCLGVLVSTVPIAILCLRGAEASVKTTVRLMLIETLVVVALSLTILIAKWPTPGGISLSPFDPRQLSNGMSGFWSAMILGVLSFCGFDVVSTAAEEAHAPRKHVPQAILIAIIGMGLFWAANAWVFTLSTPVREVLEYTRLGLPAVTLVAQSYWGWGSLIITFTAFTATIAIYISIVQGASRIVFALARHRLMPSPFARLVGARRVPRNAILGVLACAVFVDLATISVLRNGVDSYNWWASAIVFFATLTFMGVNLANVLYFSRLARRDFGVVKNLLLPLAGLALNAYLLYAAFFSTLWSSDFRMGKSVVIGCLALLGAEVVVVLSMRVFARHLFEQEAPLGAV